MPLFQNSNQNSGQGSNPPQNNNDSGIKLNIPENKENEITINVSALQEEKEKTSFLLNGNPESIPTPNTQTSTQENNQAPTQENNPTPNTKTSTSENNQAPTQENNDWLEKEDELIATKEQPEKKDESSVPQEIIKQNFKVESDALNMFEESGKDDNSTPENNQTPTPENNPTPNTQTSTPENNQAPTQESNPTQENTLPTNNLENDHAIIKELEASKNKAEPVAEKPVSQPSGNEVNLDDIITPAATTPTINQIGLETGIHGYEVPETAAEKESFLPTTDIQKNKKLLPYIGGLILILLVVFVLRKQYPLEFQSILGNKEKIENPLPQEIEEPINNEEYEETPEEDINGEVSTGENTGETVTGEILPTNENSSGSQQNSDINPALINYHPATEDNNENFEAFQDLEEILDEEQKNKEKVLDYKEEGKKYIVLGIKTKNKEIEKYGRFLFVRAEEILEKIEKETEITTDDLRELEEYLQKLTELSSNDRGSSASQQSQQTVPNEQEFSASENTRETY